jgi:hypothetical protein
LPINGLPAETVNKLNWPRYPQLPATPIGRLARDITFQNLGELLLLDALKRAWTNREIGSLAVIVDAKDEGSRRFYARYGFLSFPDTANRMYLPMKTIGRLFGE